MSTMDSVYVNTSTGTSKDNSPEEKKKKKKTKKCPYCGEEILFVAKKCKHCGERLDREKKNRFVFWFLFMLAIIIVIIAYITLPSEEIQREKAQKELSSALRKGVRNELSDQDIFTQYLANSIMEDDDVSAGLGSLLYDIDIENYKVFSIIKLKEKSSKETGVIGFAAFGCTFILPLEELVED